MKIKFVRTDVLRYSKVGKNRKKLQVWRRPRGRHNKIREKRFGYPRMPTVGYKTPRKESGLIEGKKQLIVHNVRDIENADKSSILIIARVGAKKKIEMIKKAEELKFKILNLTKEKK